MSTVTDEETRMIQNRLKTDQVKDLDPKHPQRVFQQSLKGGAL
jgi:hypothetical protein